MQRPIGQWELDCQFSILPCRCQVVHNRVDRHRGVPRLLSIIHCLAALHILRAASVDRVMLIHLLCRAKKQLDDLINYMQVMIVNSFLISNIKYVPTCVFYEESN